MPALPAAPNILKVTYHIQDSLDFNALCRDYFIYSGTAPNDAVCDTIAQDIYTQWVTNFIAQLSSLNQILEVTVEDLTSATSGVGSYTHTTQGTRAGTGLAGGTCVLVNKPIARRYRGGKPRTYWPFFTASDILTAQSWVTASVTSLNTELAAYYAALNGLTVSGTVIGSLYNVSYYSGFVSSQNPITGRWRNISKPRVAPALDPVLSAVATNRIASQRRRNLTRP